MPFTNTKNSGDELPASVLAALITEARCVGAVKLSNQTTSANTVFLNDNDLVVPLAASAVYVGLVVIYYNSATTPDFKVAMSLPAGAAGQWGGLVFNASGTLTTFGTNDITAGTAVGGLGSEVSATFTVQITMGSTAGNGQIQWAQNVSDPSTTTVFANSYVSLHRIS